jgi:hypothetical protein
MTGNEKALTKKATLITETRDHSLKDIKVDECQNSQRLPIISQSLWTDTLAYTSYCPSSEAVNKISWKFWT